MWQCAIQRPRLRHVEQDVDGLAGPNEHRVLPDEVLLRCSVAREHDEPTGTVDVERVVHRMVGVHLVDEPQLDLIPQAERPVDRMVGGAGVAVDELPSRVRRRRQPVDVDHVVLPLDPVRGRVIVIVMVVMVVVAHACSWPPWPSPTRAAGTSFIPHSGQRSGLSLTTSGCIGQA